MASAGRVCLDVVNGLLNRSDLFRLFVRNLGLELFFKSHDQFHSVEGIGAEIVYERRVVVYFFLFNAQMLDNDLLDALFDRTHDGYFLPDE
jgi:hypothetical protein